MLKLSQLILITCIVTIISACSGVSFSDWRFPYMMEVEQGNYVTLNQLKQVKLGMTREQVAFIISQPLTQFMFNQYRWDYIYQDYTNNQLVRSYYVTIFFDKTNHVNKISSSNDLFDK